MKPLRQRYLYDLQQQKFDVLVIGAGINGASIAAALSAKGVSVALIDRGDFAGGTSQESSNLIWGGIKYLQNGEVWLVNKLCQARNRLMRAFPSNVREMRFLLTVPPHFRHHPLYIYAGCLVYWAMGRFFTKMPRYLNRKKLKSIEPSLNTKVAQGALEYSDAWLIEGDARFVFHFISRAMKNSASIMNYLEARSLKYVTGSWETRARDVISKKEITIRSTSIINACGPYIDIVNETNKITTNYKHIFSKGIHLILPPITQVAQRVLSFFDEANRLFFVIPLGDKSCVGTTDTNVKKLPPHVSDKDRDFVLHNINHYLRLKKPLNKKDIIAERCGVRPLVIAKNSKKNSEPATTQTNAKNSQPSWFSLSRKHIIEVDRERKYMSVFGGKLTDCVNIGNEVSRIIKKFNIQFSRAKKKWYGESSQKIKQKFAQQARELANLCPETSHLAQEKEIERLWRRYDSNACAILRVIQNNPKLASQPIAAIKFMKAELYYISHYEMIETLDDLLRRRSNVSLTLSLHKAQYRKGLHEICNILWVKSKRKKNFENIGNNVI